jgi:hypothetical protein
MDSTALFELSDLITYLIPATMTVEGNHSHLPVGRQDSYDIFFWPAQHGAGRYGMTIQESIAVEM